MLCPAMNLTCGLQGGDLIGQYVKMGLNLNEDLMDSEEKDLIRRSREGDTQAMEALYEQYKRPLFNLVYRHTYNFEAAEDLIQDIFLKIFTHLHDVHNEDTFKGWVYRIALNTCYGYLRGKKSQLQKTVPLSEVERKVKGESHEPQERMIKGPLDEAIQALPTKLKSTFLLYDVQGFKHEEIAQILGCAVGTSKSQLFKARMKIRDYLKNKQIL